jgi:hypothetical protein
MGAGWAPESVWTLLRRERERSLSPNSPIHVIIISKLLNHRVKKREVACSTRGGTVPQGKMQESLEKMKR